MSCFDQRLCRLLPALAVGLAVSAASIAPTPAKACQCWEAPGPEAPQGRMVQDLEGLSGPHRNDAGHCWSHGYEARGADCRPNEGRARLTVFSPFPRILYAPPHHAKPPVRQSHHGATIPMANGQCPRGTNPVWTHTMPYFIYECLY